jgi:hypothetical protein
MAPFSTGDRGRSVEPVIQARFRIITEKSSSAFAVFKNAICNSRPSTASRSRLRAM